MEITGSQPWLPPQGPSQASLPRAAAYPVYGGKSQIFEKSLYVGEEGDMGGPKFYSCGSQEVNIPCLLTSFLKKSFSLNLVLGKSLY